MENRVFSAYNLARGVLLNSKLAVAESGNQPLKLLDIVISGMGMDSTAGLWLRPLHAIPAVPRVFPFDLIYLDKEYRVMDTAEMGPGIEFPAFRAEVASALVLPSDILRRTQTGQGDRFIVCLTKDLEMLLAASADASSATPALHDPPPPVPASSNFANFPAPVVERAPETPIVATPYRASDFEHSILSAVARASATPPPSSASSEDLPPQAAALAPNLVERSRKAGAAIIEHHVDPEDLFSNWVVSEPPHAEFETSPRRTAPQNVIARAPKRERKPIKENSADPPPQTRGITGAVPPAQPEPQTASTPVDAASATQDRPPTLSPIAVPQPAPATTFTAGAFGLWQASMPTAFAPAAAPKSSSPTKTPTQNGTKQVTPKPAHDLEPPKHQSVVGDSSGSSATEPRTRIQTASPVPRTAQEKSVSTDRVLETSETPKVSAPGDFLSSLQQKLQRAEQSRLDSGTEPAARPASESAPAPFASSKIKSPTATKVSSVLTPEPSDKSATSPLPPAVSGTKSALKIKPPPAVPLSKPEAPPRSLRTKFKQWLNPVANPSDRRRAARRYVPGVVAHYFTGGAPKPHEIADISMGGMYLLTDDRWMPGTMIQMTLQKPCARGERKQSMNVLSRIVRRGSDGVAVEFVMPEALSHIAHDIQPSQATDRFALARFL